MRSLIPIWVAAGLAGGSPSAIAARPLDVALEGAPSSANGVAPALVFAIHDLREAARLGEARWRRKRGVKAIDRLVGPDGKWQTEKIGAFGDMDAFNQALSKEGPIPASIVAGASEAGWWVVGSFKATEGVLDRMVASQPLSPLELRRDGEVIRATTELGEVVGKYERGWLRLTMGMDQSFGPAGLSMPEAIAGDADKAQVLLHYDGTTPVGDLFRAMADEPSEQIMALARSVSMVSAFEGDRSAWAKVIVDHPQLPLISPLLTLGRAHPGAAEVWGPQATAMLDIAIPPGLLEAASLAAPDMPEPLKMAIKKLDGRFGLALFGAMMDWGLSLGFRSEAAAREAAPLLKAGLQELTKRGNESWGRFFIDVGPGRFAVRPDPALAGYDFVVAKDRVVVLSQPARQLRPQSPDLRTPTMRALLAADSFVTGYAVVGTDGSVYEIYRWVVAAALVDWGEDNEIWSWVVERYADVMPAMVSLVQANIMFLYDMGMAVDLKGNLLVLELVSSEL